MPKTTVAQGASRGGAPDNPAEEALVRGRYVQLKDGALEFSSGNAAPPDAMLKRGASGGFSVVGPVAFSDSVDVTGTLTAFGYFGAGGNFGIGSGVSLGGFFGATAIGKPTVSGHRNNPEAALKNLLAALANLGLITDSTDVS
jgi:hypothetical protein